MTKRTNPYCEDFIPQSKTFIGTKQFNQSSDRMNGIYDKTLQMLFDGARKKPVPNLNTDGLYNNNNKSIEKLRQLCLAEDGTLQYTPAKIKHVEEIIKRNCKCGAESNCFCYYCETQMCENCNKVCSVCNCIFCSHCYIERFDEDGSCISCFRS